MTDILTAQTGPENTVRQDAPTDQHHEQFVSFRVGERIYGVDIMQVREITQWAPTTPLPNQPAHTRGVLNLRGTIVPVHDLRMRFGGPQTEPQSSHVIVIVSIREKLTGILVDAVSDIISAVREDILPVPNASDIDTPAIAGLVNKEETVVAIIDLDALFPADRKAAL
ncbi:MAG: chemotaxis protein CheW [Pseudomonadota bacterium]